MENQYDVIIVGSGPAGLSAGIYSARYNLSFLIIGLLPGGEISEAHKVCNFPSQNNISGFELTQKMVQHVMELDGEIKQEEVAAIRKQEEGFVVTSGSGEEYSAKKIILATGREKVKLNAPGEDKFLGRGVSYCATCDGAFYKDKIVAVIGGGNTAVTSALLLSEHAKKVYIIYRKEKFFRAEPAWLTQLEKEPKIEPIFSSNVVNIIGEDSVKAIELDTGKKLELDGVFIEIGSIPNTRLPEQLGVKLEKGYIITGKKQETNVKGVFAAGDATSNYLKQVVTAAAEGAIAATAAFEEIRVED